MSADRQTAHEGTAADGEHKTRPTASAASGPIVADRPSTAMEALLLAQRSSGNRLVARRLGAATRAAQRTRTIQRVLIGGKDVKPGGKNEEILGDALDAIIDMQDAKLGQPDSWLNDIDAIILELSTSGVSDPAKDAIKQLYKELAEVSFLCNPILNEAWQRCLDATKNKASYAAVGGKFKDKLPDVLHELATDFPGLAIKCKSIRVPKMNKEHGINKGAAHGGSQTGHANLWYAGTPAAGSKETLAEPHKGLHGVKSGTGKVDFKALDPVIRGIIETAQKAYKVDALGKLV